MKNFGLKIFICVMITAITGFGLLYFAFKDFNGTWDGLMTIFARDSFSVISAAIMICVALFLIISYFIVKLSPSRNIVVKLVAIEQNVHTNGWNTPSNENYLLVFRGEDNKKYAYDINDTGGYETNKNYQIEVKGNMLISMVISVIGETQDACEPKPKKVKNGYWSRMYLPGKMDATRISLPLLYGGVVFGSLWLKSRWEHGYFNGTAFILLAGSIYCILYDFYQKFKRR